MRQRSATELNRRRQLRGLCHSDSDDRRQLAARGPREAVKAAACMQEDVGDVERPASLVPAPASTSATGGFVVAESGGAVALQLLAWTIIGRQFFHQSYYRFTRSTGFARRPRPLARRILR